MPQLRKPHRWATKGRPLEEGFQAGEDEAAMRVTTSLVGQRQARVISKARCHRVYGPGMRVLGFDPSPAASRRQTHADLPLKISATEI